ncbi:MAG TPA: hypothetical protein VJ836_00870 [Candidatus Saccharimonadales bacterium]|nr:hypothetical protein [Candidatus Saccharimonadales bacterium]
MKHGPIGGKPVVLARPFHLAEVQQRGLIITRRTSNTGRTIVDVIEKPDSRQANTGTTKAPNARMALPLTKIDSTATVEL